MTSVYKSQTLLHIVLLLQQALLMTARALEPARTAYDNAAPIAYTKNIDDNEG